MISSKKDYLYYVEADRVALGLPRKLSLALSIRNVLLPNIWKFQKTLRKLEYYKNCKKGNLSSLYTYYLTYRFKKISMKLGFSIPLNVFGPGLSVAHHGTIIVNGGAKIGANCRLHACVNIGTEAGHGDKAPQLGDNCYIGPGVKIYGDINISEGTAIGANAVVNKSFEEKNIAIAGVPAKKIGNVDTFNFLRPATFLIEKGYNLNKDIDGLTALELKEMLNESSDIY